MDIILWHRILNPYELAVKELLLKFNHLKKEYEASSLYCPIEKVNGRVKSISSILDKLQKKSIPIEKMEEEVEDIAGIRIICQFVEDIDQIVSLIEDRFDMIIKQKKDYVHNQKESGYRSYHLVVYYVVETIEGFRRVQVEIQIRTMAMDFWATIEHSLQYKYKANIPTHITEKLMNAAAAIVALDSEMSSVRSEIMDAQLSSQIKYNLLTDILTEIESLYKVTSTHELKKIQDEFLTIYGKNDLDELKRFHRELDCIAEGYHAQKKPRGEGL